MSPKFRYFLRYTLGFSFSATFIGYASFLLIKSYLISKMEPELEDWMVVVAIFLSTLPFSISIGARALKYEIEEEKGLEKFIHLFSNSILLFALGIASVTFFIQNLSKWVLPIPADKTKLVLNYADLLYSGTTFWLGAFPLNFCALLILLGLMYGLHQHIDKQIFEGVIVAKKKTKNWSSYFVPVLIRVYVATLFVLILILGSVDLLFDLANIGIERGFYWEGEQEAIFFSGLVIMPYALLIALHLRIPEQLKKPKFRYRAIFSVMLITSFLGAVLNYLFLRTFMGIKNPILLIFSSEGVGMVRIGGASPITFLVLLLLLPFTLLWYKYIAQLLAVRSLEDAYEHLVAEV